MRPSYSYRTLELLAEQEPEDELYFLLGADMAAGLASWKEPERVLELARLGVVPRPGVGLGAVRVGAGAARCLRPGGDNRDATLRSVLDHDQGASAAREGRCGTWFPSRWCGLIAERGLYR